MSIDSNKQLAREWIAAMGRGDVETMKALFAEDGTGWALGSLPFSGPANKAGMVAGASAIFAAFPKGMDFTIHRMTAEDDRVSVEAESHAQHVSGKPYHNRYHFLMRARDGVIVEWREYFDTMHAYEVLIATS